MYANSRIAYIGLTNTEDGPMNDYDIHYDADPKTTASIDEILAGSMCPSRGRGCIWRASAERLTLLSQRFPTVAFHVELIAPTSAKRTFILKAGAEIDREVTRDALVAAICRLELITTFDATATIAQLRKPSVKVLDGRNSDEIDIERELNRMAEGESVRVKVAVIEAVIERVRDIDDRLKGVDSMDIGNSYAWGAWASVLTGSALAWSPDREDEIVTATLDHVVEAIVGNTTIYYLDKSGLVIF